MIQTSGQAQKRQILTSTAYIKGRICLQAGDDHTSFSLVSTIRATKYKKWKSWIYVFVLRFPLIRRSLPGRIKLALRLPESTL